MNSEMVPFTDHASLDVHSRKGLQAAVARLSTLEEVIHWGLRLPEQRVILAIIVQDEYSHDVILEWQKDHYVVFDTT